MDAPAGLALAQRLADLAKPIVAYKALTRVFDRDPASPRLRVLRERIAVDPVACDLLGHRDERARIPERARHAYRKWQGAHWTLVLLSLIDYPTGDASLAPLFDQVHEWLFDRRHLRPPSTAVYAGQTDRVRRCASQEGNAIWYAVKLGHFGPETRALADRLIEYQWPDGGWNCDKRLEASTSSFQETTIPLRGLAAYAAATGYEPAHEAAGRAAELLLTRRLLWRRRDGEFLRPAWGGRVDAVHFPIQFHDVLFALEVMCDTGHIDDERCRPALDLLQARQLPGGGFGVDDLNARHADRVASRASWADWGPGGPRTPHPLVSAIALGVLARSGRLSVAPQGD